MFIFQTTLTKFSYTFSYTKFNEEFKFFIGYTKWDPQNPFWAWLAPPRAPKLKFFEIWSYHISLESYFDTGFRFQLYFTWFSFLGPFWAREPHSAPKMRFLRIMSYYISLEAYFDTGFKFLLCFAKFSFLAHSGHKNQLFRTFIYRNFKFHKKKWCQKKTLKIGCILGEKLSMTP